MGNVPGDSSGSCVFAETAEREVDPSSRSARLTVIGRLLPREYFNSKKFGVGLTYRNGGAEGDRTPDLMTACLKEPRSRNNKRPASKAGPSLSCSCFFSLAQLAPLAHRGGNSYQPGAEQEHSCGFGDLWANC